MVLYMKCYIYSCIVISLYKYASEMPLFESLVLKVVAFFLYVC